VVNLQLAHSMSMKTKLDELENIMDELTATSSKALNLLQRPNSSVIHKSYSTGTGFAHSMSLKTKFEKMENLMDELTETSSKALNLVQKRNSSVNSSDKSSFIHKAYRNKIVGGMAVEEYTMPWQVAVVYSDDSFIDQFCGGTILCPKFVLSAAHCTHKGAHDDPKRSYRKPKDFDILAGAHDLSNKNDPTMTRHHVKAYHNPPQYKKNKDYDITILELKTPIALDDRNKKAVFLPTPTFEIKTGTKFVISGWGAKKFSGWPEDKLQAVTVPAVKDEDCKAAYPSHFTTRMFCAGYVEEGGKDACQGDSGGPLTWLDPRNDKIKIIGVVSFGRDCAKPGHPGVYAKVTTYLDWIKKIIGSCNPDTCEQDLCMKSGKMNWKTLQHFYSSENNKIYKGKEGEKA